MTKLFGDIVNIEGAAIPGAKIYISINPAPQAIADQIVTNGINTYLADENGHFEILLLPGLNVTVTVPSANFTTTGFIPFSGEINFTQLS